MGTHVAMGARMLRVSLVFGLVVTLFIGCSPPSLVPGDVADAAEWPDVALPDAPPPDGYVITALGRDGAPVAMTAAATCAAIDGFDGGLDSDVFPTDASIDAAPCATPLTAGDLIFDEVMIATIAGSDDRGQWLEVRSTRACTTDLIGLHASALHGQSFRTLDVTTDTMLGPGAYFLIADTLDPTENDGLPGLVFAWAGSPADALHKTSDTITLSVGTVMLDTLSYPDKKRPEATSYAFPWACSPPLRADFANWQPSTATWAPGFFGTPGAPNTDVRCASVRTAVCGGDGG